MFKDIIIDDQLILSGAINKGEEIIAIVFKPDDDANDLIAEIQGNVNIKIGKNSIMLESFVFNIIHSDNFDAYFKLKESSNITIECDPDVKKEEFVKFQIDCQHYETNIKFVGKLPSVDPEEESLIKIFGKRSLNIKTTSDLPASIHQFFLVSIHVLSPDVKTIHGPIEYEKFSYPIPIPAISFYNDQKEKVSLEIVNGIIINQFFGGSGSPLNVTGIMSPELDVVINKIEYQGEVKMEMSIFSVIGNESVSKIVFKEPLPEYIKFSESIIMISKVIGIIENEDDFILVKNNHTILEARTQDTKGKEFSIFYLIDNDNKVAHGFGPTSNCLAVKLVKTKEYITAIQIYASIRPSMIPYVIDIVDTGEKTNGELVFDDSNIQEIRDLNKVIPNKSVGIVVRLFRDMPVSVSFDFNSIINDLNIFSVSMKSMNLEQHDVHVSLPASRFIAMDFFSLNIRFVVESLKSKEAIARFLNFTDCSFVNPDEFSINNKVEKMEMDVDSLNGLVNKALKSYQNKLTVNSANVIIFSKEGWEFRENRARNTSFVKASNYPNISIQTRRLCLLMIRDPELTEIPYMDFDAFPQSDNTVYFEMGKFWRNITKLNGFKINVNGASKVDLNTASYPIPNIFGISKSNISYSLKTDIHGHFDIINLENNYEFKDEKLEIDFTHLVDVYRYVKGEKVIFSGKSEIAFHDGIGKFQVNDAVFKNYVQIKFSNIEVSNTFVSGKSSKIDGNIKFGPAARMKLNWTIPEAPRVVFNKLSNGVAQSLELIYDSDKVNKDIFKKKMIDSNGIILMRGNFDCQKMIKKIKFSSVFEPFGANNDYLMAECDSSSDGFVMLLKGLKEIPDDDQQDDSDQENKNSAISSGGIAGIVIVIVIVVTLIISLLVYFVQKQKIKVLKEELETIKTKIASGGNSADESSNSEPMEVNE